LECLTEQGPIRHELGNTVVMDLALSTAAGAVWCANATRRFELGPKKRWHKLPLTGNVSWLSSNWEFGAAPQNARVSVGAFKRSGPVDAAY
jgi:hypothetical protein